ncbi:MAG: TetR/AcrR family transcriptional regulator [Solirubrobacteraceae bacterium]
MVRSAAVLIREHGLAHTGMREIAEAADAPRGSLQHYFPDGKDQVVSEAIEWVAGQVTKPLLDDGSGRPTPAHKVVAEMFGRWRRVLESTGFQAGCAIVSTISDASSNDRLRAKSAEAFAAWRRALADALRRGGVPRASAERLAVTAIAAMEGAMVLARADRDLAAYDAVAKEMAALVAAAS